MKKSFIAAGIMIISGAAAAAAAFALGAGRSDGPAEYKTETINAEKLHIIAEYNDISIVRGNELAITYPAGEDAVFSSFYEDGTYTAECGRRVYNVFGLELDLSLDLDTNDGSRTVRLEVPESFDGSIAVELPAGDAEISGLNCGLDIELSAGNINIKDCMDIKANAGAGNIYAESVSGNIELVSSAGNIEIRDCSGNTVLYSNTGRIKAAGGTFENIECSAELGSIEAENISASNISLVNEKGDISCKNIRGNIAMKLDMGDITAENISGDRITADNSLGDIDLKINGSEQEYKVNGIGESEKTVDTSNGVGETNIEVVQ